MLHQLPDVVHRVVGCGVQFVDVVGTLFVEGGARFALVAGFSLCRGTHAVDGFGKDTCTGRFAYTARTAEEVGVCQFACGDGILQGGSQGTLSHYRFKGRGAVFSCRYDIIFHIQGVLITYTECGDVAVRLSFCANVRKKKKFFSYSSYLCAQRNNN